MLNQIRIFLIEDEPVSAGITLRMLKEAGLDGDVTAAATLEAGLSGLAAGGADIALVDMGLPDRGGVETVSEVCARFPRLPVVVMTGTDDEAVGLEALKRGAQDYLVKGRFNHRELKRVMGYAVERKALLNEKEELIARLQDALRQVRLLTGLLPICCECKKIRTSAGAWMQMEAYITENSGAVFTHGYCEECYKRRMKELRGGHPPPCP